MIVRITDVNSAYYGQEFEGNCIYYDVYHTGSTKEKPAVDLFSVQTPEGSRKFLSTQIDAEYYWEQRRQEQIKELGADVGDIVLIIEPRSNYSKLGFDWKAAHKITKIDSSGHVEFDNGMATCFRPVMKLIPTCRNCSNCEMVKYNKEDQEVPICQLTDEEISYECFMNPCEKFEKL